jgi:hypothetical protein
VPFPAGFFAVIPTVPARFGARFRGVPVRLARWAATRALGSRPVPLHRVFDCTRHPEGLGRPRPSALGASVPREHREPYARPGPARSGGPPASTAGPGDGRYAPPASPRSSAGQSMGLLIPWSQVRVLPGAPTRGPPSRGRRDRAPQPPRGRRTGGGRRASTAGSRQASRSSRLAPAIAGDFST